MYIDLSLKSQNSSLNDIIKCTVRQGQDEVSRKKTGSQSNRRSEIVRKETFRANYAGFVVKFSYYTHFGERKEAACIRIAVIDDDKICLRETAAIVAEHLKKSGQECEMKCYRRSRELLWELEDGNGFDLYLIDVEMPGINGLELAQQIRLSHLNPYLIFISSHIEYSIECFEYQTFRYILKSEVREKLPKALDALQMQIQQREHRYYVIENQTRVVSLDYEDIYYLNVQGKYTYFYTRRGMFRERLSLASVYEKLQSDEFIYVDKGTVVNLSHVLELDNRSVLLRDRTAIQVSGPQFRNVKRAVSDYWRRQL